MNWTLISVIVIIAVFAIIGLKRGLLRMVFSLAFAIAAIIITVFLAPGITKYIKAHTKWDENLRAGTESYLEKQDVLLDENTSEEINVLPDVFQKEINKNADEYIEKGYETYNAYIVDSVTDCIFSAAVTVGIFLALIVIFLIIRAIISGVGKLPVICTVNRFAGMLAGILFGFVAVSLFFVVVMVFNNTDLAKVIYEDIESNAFLSFVYNNNLLMILMAKIF